MLPSSHAGPGAEGGSWSAISSPPPQAPMRHRLRRGRSEAMPAVIAGGMPQPLGAQAQCFRSHHMGGQSSSAHTYNHGGEGEVISEIKGKTVPVKLWARVEEVESGALDQLRGIASLPWVAHHVAVMPDVH